MNKLSSLTLCLAIAVLSSLRLSADVVVLKNGDTLSGTVLEESATSVVLQSPVLGELILPKGEVASVTRKGEDAVEEETAEETVEPAEHQPGITERVWEEITSTLFPEGFTGEILIAYDYSESSDIQSGTKLGLKGTYEQGKHTLSGDIFYAYTRKKDAGGNVSKPTDRYGFNAAYEYDIQEPYFLRASDNFVIDRVKKLDPQNDLNLLAGWRAIDEEKMSLDLAAGPGVRYQKTSSSSGQWDPLITFNQSAFYQLNSSVRFDELINYSVDPTDTGSYSLLFEVAAAIRLTNFAEPKIIYRNSYDSTVGAGGIKREQSLLVALAVPF